MGILFLIFFYIFSLIVLIKAMINGKGIFFPIFKRIDEKYGNIYPVWDTWWGKLGYYINLIFNLSIIALVIYTIHGLAR
ncbi:MAG: hypothetical protein LBG15_04875 [Dysgonamonadaceae bacterium]|jgi:hypothetical protein|nr:hypothetical protein [Dysgonamonadaceae bacterium]